MNKIIVISVCAVMCIAFSGGFFVKELLPQSSEPEPVAEDECISRIIWVYTENAQGVKYFIVEGHCSLAGDGTDPKGEISIQLGGPPVWSYSTSKVYDGTILIKAYGSGAPSHARLVCPHGNHPLEIVKQIQPYV